MIEDYETRRRELMAASFALGQAQRDMEEAEARFKEALKNIHYREALRPVIRRKIIARLDGER